MRDSSNTITTSEILQVVVVSFLTQITGQHPFQGKADDPMILSSHSVFRLFFFTGLPDKRDKRVT
jgi:hypothetical protein